MAFEASIQKFSGPLDLMLHLIKEEKLDIFDLDMERLCDQYLKYINEMMDLKLEVESEYLVELAMLVEYKSKKLLPKRENEEEDSAYEEDPKEKLVRRLLEYQRYKEASLKLETLYLERQLQYAKSLSDTESLVKDSDDKLSGEVKDLWRAMNKVMRRLQLSKPLSTKLTTKEVSVEDRILMIKARFNDLDEVFNFKKLVEDCENLHDFVVTFLGILDLAKNHILSFEVDENDENKITGNIDYRALVGDTLSIRTTINELINDGTCSLTITGPHEQVYKLTDKIIPNSASTSTCVGFDINMDLIEKDEEQRAGKWTITIDLASGGRTGQLVSEMTL